MNPDPPISEDSPPSDHAPDQTTRHWTVLDVATILVFLVLAFFTVMFGLYQGLSFSSSQVTEPDLEQVVLTRFARLIAIAVIVVLGFFWIRRFAMTRRWEYPTAIALVMALLVGFAVANQSVNDTFISKQQLTVTALLCPSDVKSGGELGDMNLDRCNSIDAPVSWLGSVGREHRYPATLNGPDAVIEGLPAGTYSASLSFIYTGDPDAVGVLIWNDETGEYERNRYTNSATLSNGEWTLRVPVGDPYTRAVIVIFEA